MRAFTVSECAYLAGLLDGEGCFTFNGSTVKAPLVQVEMTHKPVMDFLGDRLDATVTSITRRDSRPQHATSYKVALHGSKAQALCRQLMPYLRVKRPHAELIVAYPYLPIRGGRGKHVPSHMAETRRVLVERMRHLNQKGPLA